MTRSLHITGDAAADALLSTDANALLLAMVLDQQVPMEKAFAGPAVIAERMGGVLDVRAIAGLDPEEFIALCARRPAIHRFPKAMAGRLQAVARVLVEDWDGDAARLFASASTGAELKSLVADLPGFGDQKASIFVALLAKQWGVAPEGWQEAAGKYAAGFVSVADVVDAESLARVREAKKAAKAASR